MALLMSCFAMTKMSSRNQNVAMDMSSMHKCEEEAQREGKNTKQIIS